MKDKFIPLNKRYPTEFDLVIIVDKDGKTQNAWWTGQIWDAREMKIGEPIAWKRRSEG